MEAGVNSETGRINGERRGRGQWGSKTQLNGEGEDNGAARHS